MTLPWRCWTLAGVCAALQAATLRGHPPAGFDDPPGAEGRRVGIVIDGEYRHITSNGLPDHATGRFPNPGNPGRIESQNLEFRVPVRPVWTATPVETGPSGTTRRPMVFGVAINGVVFDPGTAEWWNDDPASGWHFEALAPRPRLGVDENHAHVQPPTGLYHYHGVPTALVERLGAERSAPSMILVGWAADGFPIYGRWGYDEALDPASAVRGLKPGYRLRAGMRPDGGPGGAYDGTFVEDFEFVPGAGDLDECNGRYGVTPEFPRGTYYYVITDEFPFVPRLFRGVPDESFRKPRRPAGSAPRRPR